MSRAIDEALLERLAAALRPVPSLAGLVLGGSRARGQAHAGSDHDLGLYYRGETPLDVAALREALAPLVDDPPGAALTEPGEWGPWINGGAWLSVGGRKVDLIYRNLDAVADVIASCREGRIVMAYQPGHPHGFCSAIWMGEVALCRPLFDPHGMLAALKAQTQPFPAPLRRALIERFGWEARFAIDNAALAVARDDQTHIAGCLYRSLSCLAQVLFALNERYLINEKGALAEAAQLPNTVAGCRADAIWAALGDRRFARALERARELTQAVEALVDQAAGAGPT